MFAETENGRDGGALHKFRWRSRFQTAADDPQETVFEMACERGAAEIINERTDGMVPKEGERDGKEEHWGKTHAPMSRPQRNTTRFAEMLVCLARVTFTESQATFSQRTERPLRPINPCESSPCNCAYAVTLSQYEAYFHSAAAAAAAIVY